MCRLASKNYFLTLSKKQRIDMSYSLHVVLFAWDTWAHGSCSVAIRETSRENTEGMAEGNHRKNIGT